MKKGGLKVFTNFTEKQQCQGLFFNKTCNFEIRSYSFLFKQKIIKTRSKMFLFIGIYRYLSGICIFL